MYLRKRKRVSEEENVPPNDLGMEVFDMADALLKSQQDLIEQQVRTIEALTDTIIELRSPIIELRSQHEKHTDND